MCFRAFVHMYACRPCPFTSNAYFICVWWVGALVLACMCVDVCGLCGIGPSHGLVVVLSSLTHAYACE